MLKVGDYLILSDRYIKEFFVVRLWDGRNLFFVSVFIVEIFFFMNVKLNYWVIYGILVFGNK